MTSPTPHSRSGTPRRSTTTAPSCSSPTNGAAARSRCASRSIPRCGAATRCSTSRARATAAICTSAATSRCRRGRPRRENCVAHNGSLVPVPGRDIMAQAFYQGGATVFDFTDSANIKEIAYFDRGPIDAKQPGHRRLLVGLLLQRVPLRLGDCARPRHLPADAERVSLAERNRRREAGDARGLRRVERSERAVPAALRLAGQLRRRARVSGSARARQGAAAGTHRRAQRRDEGRRGRERGDAARGLTKLDGLAADLAKDAATAMGINAARMRAAASTIQKRDAELK